MPEIVAVFMPYVAFVDEREEWCKDEDGLLRFDGGQPS
jgi:hypothetical protein